MQNLDNIKKFKPFITLARAHLEINNAWFYPILCTLCNLLASQQYTCQHFHSELFCSSRSRLNISCIFSILLPRFWIIFTIIPLNSFSCRLPFSSSFVWSHGFLPCSFICCVFLCLLILLSLLCLGSHFPSLKIHISHCFRCLPPVGKVGLVGCVGFLVEGTGACVLVDEAGYFLSVGQNRVQWCVFRCL